MKTEKFDIVKAVAGQKVTNRLGDDVTLVHTSLSGKYPLLAVIRDKRTNDRYQQTYTLRGMIPSTISSHDLLLVIPEDVQKNKNESLFKNSIIELNHTCV